MSRPSVALFLILTFLLPARLSGQETAGGPNPAFAMRVEAGLESAAQSALNQNLLGAVPAAGLEETYRTDPEKRFYVDPSAASIRDRGGLDIPASDNELGLLIADEGFHYLIRIEHAGIAVLEAKHFTMRNVDPSDPSAIEVQLSAGAWWGASRVEHDQFPSHSIRIGRTGEGLRLGWENPPGLPYVFIKLISAAELENGRVLNQGSSVELAEWLPSVIAGWREEGITQIIVRHPSAIPVEHSFGVQGVVDHMEFGLHRGINLEPVIPKIIEFLGLYDAGKLSPTTIYEVVRLFKVLYPTVEIRPVPAAGMEETSAGAKPARLIRSSEVREEVRQGADRAGRMVLKERRVGEAVDYLRSLKRKTRNLTLVEQYFLTMLPAQYQALLGAMERNLDTLDQAIQTLESLREHSVLEWPQAVADRISFHRIIGQAYGWRGFLRSDREDLRVALAELNLSAAQSAAAGIGLPLREQQVFETLKRHIESTLESLSGLEERARMLDQILGSFSGLEEAEMEHRIDPETLAAPLDRRA